VDERKVTVFVGPKGKGREQTTSSEAPAYREYLDKPRGRLALVAFIVGSIGLIAVALLLIKPDSGAVGESRQIVQNVWLAALGVVLSFVVVALAKNRRISDTAVMWIGFVYQIYMCGNAAYALTHMTMTTAGIVPPVTWAEVLIVFFPMLVPSPPRLTAVAAGLSAVTRPGAVLLVSVQEDISLYAQDIVLPTVVASIAVLFALVGSRVLHGLGKDVERARRMGSYQLEELIGRGGMGEVWRASHRFLARPAAVKLIKPDVGGGGSSEGATMAQRFEREAQATSMLKSPHTVELYDYGRTEDGRFYYVMEMLDGIDLEEAIRKYGPMPPERTSDILLQLCHSLHEAHENGLVHRDIKPANLFLCHYGTDYDFIKVLDFGLVTSLRAKATAGKENVAATAANVVVGTPSFISPEVVTGERVDRRADIYAVGCLFYWLLAGRLVFEEDSIMATAVAHASKPPPPLLELAEQDLPPELVKLVECCLCKDPNERPATALEVADRLRALSFDEPWSPARATRWWQQNLPT